MKPRTTIVLLVVVLLLTGLVALDFQRGTTTDEAEANRRNLVELDVDSLRRVELVRTNQTIVIEKQADQWQIIEPVATLADYSIVRSIFDELEFAQRERTLTVEELAGIPLSDFGLAEPRVIVTLGGDQDPISVRLGSATPTGDAVYVQVDGRNEVYVVNPSVAARLDRDLDAIRDRGVFRYQPTSATRFQIKSVDRVTEFVKDDGVWRLHEPFTARANQQALNDVLRELGYLRVREFLSDDPNNVMAYGLNEPHHEISIWEDNASESQVLLVGDHPANDTTTLVAKTKSSPSIFTIPVAAIEKATVPLTELRDPKVFDFVTAEVGALKIQRGDEEIAVTRTNDSWRITAPAEMTADPAEVGRFLEQLRALEIEEFTADVATDLEPYGLTVPSVILTVQGAGTNDVCQLLLGSQTVTNALLYVTRSDEPFVYGVSPELLNWVPRDGWAWRDRQVCQLNPASIERLELSTAETRVVLERGDDQAWQMLEPAEGVIDMDQLNRLVTALAGLQAEEYEAPAAVSVPEETMPAGVYRIVATHDGKTHVLELQPAPQEGVWLATWSDPRLRFTLLAETAEHLTATVVTAPETAAPVPLP